MNEEDENLHSNLFILIPFTEEEWNAFYEFTF